VDTKTGEIIRESGFSKADLVKPSEVKGVVLKTFKAVTTKFPGNIRAENSIKAMDRNGSRVYSLEIKFARIKRAKSRNVYWWTGKLEKILRYSAFLIIK
jgi:hypothetical protein